MDLTAPKIAEVERFDPPDVIEYKTDIDHLDLSISGATP